MIKIWPLVMLAAIHNRRGGAARLWFISKSIDKDGSGKVSQAALFERLAKLKVGGENAGGGCMMRWIWGY